VLLFYSFRNFTFAFVLPPLTVDLSIVHSTIHFLFDVLNTTLTTMSSRLILLVHVEMPPMKKRRGLAGSIVSTALSAALIGTAVGLTVYRL